MIDRRRPKAWEMFGRLSIVPRIGPQIGLLAATSAGVVWVGDRRPALFRSLSVAPFPLLGIALSIFPAFWHNVSYDRWWEARRQLGALIGEARSMARLTVSTPGVNPETQRRLVPCVIAYVYALMAHRRGEAIPEETERYAPMAGPMRGAPNVPEARLGELAREAGELMGKGTVGEMVSVRMDERLSAMAAIRVACERMKGTPVPFTNTLLLHRTAYASCFFLPLGLVGTPGLRTPLFSALVAYAFLGLEELGRELEEPFAEWLNALPLTAMARTAEIRLRETPGDTNVPERVVPINFVLR